MAKTRYHSFLLRLWASEANEKFILRFSLESPETGDKFNFASLGNLMAFLEILTEEPSVLGESTEGEIFQ